MLSPVAETSQDPEMGQDGSVPGFTLCLLLMHHPFYPLDTSEVRVTYECVKTETLRKDSFQGRQGKLIIF